RCSSWSQLFTWSSAGSYITHSSPTLTMSQSKIVVEAAERNKEPILKVLEDVIPEKFGAGSPSLSALEISSGSGQHVVYFAEKFKNIMWQPSDIDEKYIESIKGFIADENLENVKSPLVIDITKKENEAWGLRDVDDLEKEAKKNGMTFDAMFNMPANNKILVWLKSEEKELA
ncbi:hypothetical protein OTU49_007594, partial [Cherax quadricarinatus]